MATKLKSKTNAKENSKVEKHLNCNQVWSMYQQSCYVYLSNKLPQQSNVDSPKFRLEESYLARAQRIAAEYATIYLESHGRNDDRNKMGRFYWMGLGAFASKTVAQTFNNPDVIGLYLATQKMLESSYRDLNAGKAINIFAKGNLWLFMDIAPWHYAWRASPQTFKDCSKQRNSDQYEPKVKSAFKSLPWASTAIPQVQNFKVTNYVEKAFSLLPGIESKASQIYTNNNDVASDQKKHLLYLASQEQIHILQNICWNHPWMVSGAKLSRMSVAPKQYISFDSFITPTLQNQTKKAKVTHQLIEDPYSYAPKELIAEDKDSRMKWINDVAKKYHNLMQDENSRIYMHNQLKIISGWRNVKGSKKAMPGTNDPNGDGDRVNKHGKKA